MKAMKKAAKLQKPYWEMTAAELELATREFDRPIASSKTRALKKPERALFEKMRKARHRSIFVSRDAGGVWVRLDSKILRQSTQYAAKQNLTLAEVINRSLETWLAAAK